MKLTIVEKNLVSWTAMHIDFVMCNNVPMAQWSTLMPCNREAAGSNLSGVLAFF